LDNQTYIKWASQDFPLNKPKTLWIHAPAGFGKSVLCARIIESLLKTKESPLIHFFCSSDVETQREPIAIIRSWILQIVDLNEAASDLVWENLSAKKTVSASSFDIWETFTTILSCVPDCTLIVDGLDECTQTENSGRTVEENVRQDFLINLKKSLMSTSARLLVISRDEVDIRSEMSSNVENPMEQTMYECSISKDDVQPDIALFSRSIVDRKLSNKDDLLRKELATQMTEKSNGMFLWIKLQERCLRKGKNKKQLFQAIENLPIGLEHAYERDWMKISDPTNLDKARALAILQWVTFALRPLTVLELTEALIVMDDDIEIDDLQIDELPDSIDQDYVDDQILGLCGSLLEIKSSDSNQPLSARTIHLVHFSVKEFLLYKMSKTETFRAEGAALSDQISQNCHLASICLRYLSYEKSWLCSSDSSCDGKCSPFLDYAVRSWYLHVSLERETDKKLAQSINRFFDPNNQNFNLWRIHLEPNQQPTSENDSVVENTPAMPLYYASLFGFIDAVKFLQQHEMIQMNAIGGRYGTALQAACIRGHSEIVAFLCSHGAEINLRGGEFTTAINAAAFAGHDKIIQYLLSLGADISITDPQGRTPLYHASQEGHLEAVKLLLENRAKINVLDCENNSPLHIAIISGHLEVAKLLIQNEANINTPGFIGWTPVNVAAAEGHLEVVKFLVENGADMNISNAKEWTSVNSAANAGHLEVVKYLVENGADMSISSAEGWTPVNSAAYMGHFEVVKYLVENGADMNISNANGCTPVNSAADGGHLEVVKYLVENGADINISNAEGWTPVNSAAHMGHFEVVRFLVENGADINISSANGWTPVNSAAAEGHFEVVKYLVQHGADITISNSDGLNAVHTAAINGHLDILKLFLGNEADINPSSSNEVNLSPRHYVDADSQDSKGRTPLSLAASQGHEAVAKLLLAYDVDADSKDSHGRTPLLWAAEYGHEAVAKLLLAHNVDADSRDSHGRTPLSWTASLGHEAVAKLLLAHNVDADSRDSDERTPLLWAADSGHEAIVKLLLAHDVDADSKDSDGRTSLSRAASHGYETVVKLLLAHDVDADSQDSEGRTPLSWAAKSGHEAVVKLLLEKSIDMNAKDNTARTPISWAKEFGREGIIKLLLEKGANAS
jgi:ankyrin repeat protein